MRLDKEMTEIFTTVYNEALKKKIEYITPEYVLYVALDYRKIRELMEDLNVDMKRLHSDLEEYLKTVNIENKASQPVNSALLDNILNNVAFHKAAAGKEMLTFSDILLGIFEEEKSQASYCLRQQGLKRLAILDAIIDRNVDKYDREDDGYGGEDDYDDDSFEEPVSYLDKFCVNLTEKALKGSLDPVIGREEEIQRTLEVLLRRTKSNPIHVGEAGVGKTVLANALANMIAEDNVPEKLKAMDIYSVDLAALLAGTKYRGDFEDRIKRLLVEAELSENVILYIDEIHNLMGAGANNSGVMDASNLLKPYLQDGRVKFMGSTTYDEYKKFIEKDKAFARRFQKIEINAPSIDDSIKILKGLKEKYEEHHHVTYTEEALEEACKLADKYIKDRHLPDTAIDLIDEAAAYIRLHKKNKRRVKISGKEVEKVVAKLARVPEEKVEESEVDKLRKLEDKIKTTLFGQDQAVATVVNAIKRARAGFNDDNKPIASLLFVGRTGVGKTELARQLAKHMDIPLIRYDMSEYQEKHSVAKLIGTPPGYVGYEQGGLLIDSIRKNPHSVLLLDEIEKAHSDIYNILLQVMDYATLTENSGRKADFRNVIIIMTSNAGAKKSAANVVGFGGGVHGESSIDKAIKDAFTPEFRNRLSKIVIFNPLNIKMAEEIARRKMKDFALKVEAKGVKLKIDEKIYEFVAQKAFSDTFGAREIERYIDREIKEYFVDLILFGDGRKNIKLKINEDKIVIE
jgi:ATP-dependent Clp protease ATP-binding subunit ClpA